MHHGQWRQPLRKTAQMPRVDLRDGTCPPDYDYPNGWLNWGQRVEYGRAVAAHNIDTGAVLHIGVSLGLRAYYGMRRKWLAALERTVVSLGGDV